MKIVVMAHEVFRDRNAVVPSNLHLGEDLAFSESDIEFCGRLEFSTYSSTQLFKLKTCPFSSLLPRHRPSP